MNNSFFIRESPEVLENMLKDKVKELKEVNKQLAEEKKNSIGLNKQLLKTVSALNHTTNELQQERKLLEWQVENKTKEILKKEKFVNLGQLAAGVAHDLRNPLALLNNNILILKKKYENDGDKNKNVFDRVDRAMTRMSHQINDVMDLVKTSPLKKEKSSLIQIFKNAMKGIMDFENVSVNLPEKDIEIICDPYKLERVFVNLISNAIDAIGGKSGSINIKFEGTKNAVILIEDSGPGINSSEIDKFFEPFFTTKLKGTGLGLFTCKNIIEQHGGVIEVNSNPTTFKLVLPKKGVELPSIHY